MVPRAYERKGLRVGYDTHMRRLWLLLKNAVDTVFDALFPRTPRSRAVERLAVQELPIDISSHVAFDVSITSLHSFGAPDIRAVIHALKYDDSPQAAEVLASSLASYVRRLAAQFQEVILVPVPLHTTRHKERGYNQSERVIRAALSRMQTPHVRMNTRLIERHRHTDPQTHLTRRERIANVSGAFSLIGTTPPSTTCVCIIDDVVTTGATLAHASAPLQKAGCTVRCIALVRADVHT